MTFDWTTGPLAEGLLCYRTQQFFEAHEHWESVWLTLREPEKSFLQSLVQVSAAFHHLRRGNRIGAISLLSRALRRLDRCSPQFCSIDVALLRNEAHEWLRALQTASAQHPATYPEFRTLDQAGCQIACGSATILGKAAFTIPYDGRNNPGQSHRSFLVK